ncbi:MAG: hypothetical protein IJV80_05690, partial [Clostridia bacterium]|nr:hypothetical protein [Clostridia bacterium]
MEERIIDDEKGRKIRLKKTADGYVDATEEYAEDLAAEETVGEESEETAEELAFEIPELEEDDEDLVNLTPSEALELRKKKKEEEEARKAEYDRLCKEGQALLDTSSFRAAELVFEKALMLDEEAVLASYGYWCAKTSNFTESEVLLEEYAEEGFDSLEHDLGYNAVQMIRENHTESFKQKIAELEEQEKPLAEVVEKKQSTRRAYLKVRRWNAGVLFIASGIVMLAAMIIAIVFASNIYSTPNGEFIMPTIVAAGAFVVLLAVFLVFTNKFLNAMRMYRANER